MNRERWSFSSKNNDKMIFYVAWNNMFTDYWKVLVLNFSELGNSSFFDSESWGKDGIYWLLKSPLFELFEIGNTVIFWAKKLIRRWYLLGALELSMIFHDLGNMVSCAVNIWIDQNLRNWDFYDISFIFY